MGCSTIQTSSTWLGRNMPSSVWNSRDQKLNASRDLARVGSETARRGNTDQAIENFSQAIELWPAEVSNYLELANQFEQKQDVNSAIRVLESGLKYDRDNIELHSNLARLQLQNQQYQTAILHADRVIQRQQDHSEAWKLRAQTMYQAQRYDEAMAACFQSLASNANDESVSELLCHIYFEQGRPMRSWSIVQQMNSKYSEQDRPNRLRLLEAQTLVQMNRTPDAIQTLLRWYRDGGDQNQECCTMLVKYLETEENSLGIQRIGSFAPGSFAPGSFAPGSFAPGTASNPGIAPNALIAPNDGSTLHSLSDMIRNSSNQPNAFSSISPLLPIAERPKFRPLTR